MGVGAVKRRAVFLDRDGVLNEAIVAGGVPQAPARVEDFHLAAGSEAALARLKELGFVLVVVTNQPGVARGEISREQVERMHELLRAALPLDAVYACYHDDADHCDCRKPKPGMLARAAAEHALDLSRSYLIGDRWRDVGAARAAGCKAILIDYQYPERPPAVKPDARVDSLEQAVAWIIGDCRRRE
jgi:D-glycero-D-manno-heptose 1,7-bisphosphate phosphatase